MRWGRGAGRVQGSLLCAITPRYTRQGRKGTHTRSSAPRPGHSFIFLGAFFIKNHFYNF